MMNNKAQIAKVAQQDAQSGGEAFSAWSKALASSYDGKTAPQTYYQDFTKAYNAGYDGSKALAAIRSEGGTSLTETQQFAAYTAGQNDAKVAPVNNALKEAVSNEQGSGEGNGTGSQWDVGVYSEGTAGILAEGTERNQSGQAAQRTVAEARRSVLSSDGNVRQSAASLGFRNGSTEKTVTVIPAIAYDQELAQISSNAKAEGKTVHFFLGELQFKADDGSGTFAVRALHLSDGTMWVRADHDRFSASQLYAHEDFHDLCEKDPGLQQRVVDKLLEKHTPEELAGICERYEAAYAGTDLTDTEIAEEFLGDAYAGIDDYGAKASKYTGEVRETVMGQQAGTERFSSDRVPMSSETDSTGRKLTADQQEFFKDTAPENRLQFCCTASIRCSLQRGDLPWRRSARARAVAASRVSTRKSILSMTIPEKPVLSASKRNAKKPVRYGWASYFVAKFVAKVVFKFDTSAYINVNLNSHIKPRIDCGSKRKSGTLENQEFPIW